MAYYSMVLSVDKVFAHGDATNQTQVDGNYIVEFEYDAKGPIIATEPYNFDFYLLDKNTKETIPVDSLSVIFTDQNKQTLLGANLKANSVYSANGRVTGTMPSEGDYSVAVSFTKEGTKIATATFNYAVVHKNTSEKNTASQPKRSLLELLASLIIGIAIGTILKKKIK